MGADAPFAANGARQVDIWSVLAEVAEQAWTLWELLLLAQPLLVLAPSPGAAAWPHPHGDFASLRRARHNANPSLVPGPVACRNEAS